jgi:hypothetical protein
MSDMKTFELEHANEMLKRKNDELELKIRQAEHQFQRATIERHLTLQAIKSGVIPDAAETVVWRAMRDFKFDMDSTGRVRRLNADGKEIADVSGAAETRSVFAEIRSTLPGCFQDGAAAAPGAAQSNGQSNGQKAPAASPNPWSREHWNKTKQWRVALVSLDDARRLAKEAGSSLDATQPPSN